MTALIEPERLRRMAAVGDTVRVAVRRDTLLMQWNIDPWSGRAISQWVVAEPSYGPALEIVAEER